MKCIEFYDLEIGVLKPTLYRLPNPYFCCRILFVIHLTGILCLPPRLSGASCCGSLI